MSHNDNTHAIWGNALVQAATVIALSAATMIALGLSGIIGVRWGVLGVITAIAALMAVAGSTNVFDPAQKDN